MLALLLPLHRDAKRSLSLRTASPPPNDCPVISGSLDADVQADILSRLYMLRSDPNAVVRQQALMVWKSVVEHTPATLKRTLSRFLIINQRPTVTVTHGASHQR